MCCCVLSLCCVSFLSTARMSSDYQNTLPYSQQTAQLAAACAANWKRNAVNAMTLKENLKAADADGDGTIDKDEFQQLVALAGAQGLTFEMVDKDERRDHGGGASKAAGHSTWQGQSARQHLEQVRAMVVVGWWAPLHVHDGLFVPLPSSPFQAAPWVGSGWTLQFSSRPDTTSL